MIIKRMSNTAQNLPPLGTLLRNALPGKG